MTVVNLDGVGNDAIYTFFTDAFQILIATSTQFVLKSFGGEQLTLTVNGTGFTYGDSTVNLLTGGTITGLNAVGDQNTSESWSGFSVSALEAYRDLQAGNQAAFYNLFFEGDDIFNVTGRAPVNHFGVNTVLALGKGGNDTFNFSGDSFISTGQGGIQLVGGDDSSGSDVVTLTGGLKGIADPFDTIKFGQGINLSISNIKTVNLRAGFSYTIITNGFDQGRDAGIPLTINGSGLGPNDKMIVGTNVAGLTNMSGASGSLILLGGAADDIFQDSTNDDTFNGGAGSDTVSYATTRLANIGITVDLSNPAPQSVSVGRGSDTFISIENITGTNSWDALTGNEGNNIFYGLGRDDTIDGRGGADTAAFRGNRSAYTITRTSNGHFTISGSDDTDTLSNIEYAKFDDQTVHLPGTGASTDFDGDSKSDMLLRDAATGAGKMWLMNGSSISSAPEVISPSPLWSAAGIGDFDNDGRSDILMQNADGTIAIWEMNGATRIDGGIVRSPGPEWTIIGTGDFNGDGKSDLLMTQGDGTIGIWEMDGTNPIDGGIPGNPGAGWRVAGTGDFNGDGNSDILLQNGDGRIAIWQMQGTALAGGGTVGNPGTEWIAKGVGDFNGDGKADILLNRADGTIAVWEMNGTNLIGGGTIGNPGLEWTASGTGDFNSDGKADILLTQPNGAVAVWEMDGTSLIGGGTAGNIGANSQVLGNFTSRPHASADFNGDGYSDILLQGADGTLGAWEINGTSAVNGGTIGNPSSAWTAKGTGDFNGDGKADVLMSQDDGTIGIWELDGIAAVAGGVAGNPGSQWTAKATGDFNGDGKADILLTQADGTIAIWEMDGTNLIGGGTVGNPGGQWTAKATGDFNGDGKADILLAQADGTIAIWEMNGASVIGGGTVGNPGAQWAVKAAGDFNGDGKSDILLTQADGTIAIWEMNGTSLIGGGTVGNAGPQWTAAGTGDFNGDGKADILLTQSNGALGVWEMNGASLIGSGTIGNPGSTWHVVAG